MILLIAGISNGPAFGWGADNHLCITRQAVRWLPVSDTAMLGSAADSLIERYCLYPDWYRAALNNKDSLRILQMKPYVELPLLGDLAKYHRTEDHESEICFVIAAELMQQTVAWLQAGQPVEAARFLGSLVHFVEDNACPVHVIDNELVGELLPKPASLDPLTLHQAVERPTFPMTLPPREPVLLGRSVVEAAETIQIRFVGNRKKVRPLVVPLIQAMYAGNEQEANRGRAQAAAAAARLASDVIHTVCVLARVQGSPIQGKGKP